MVPDSDNTCEGVSNLSVLSSSGSRASNDIDKIVEIKKGEEARRRKEPCLLYRAFYAEPKRAGDKTNWHHWVIKRGSPLLSSASSF